MNERINHITAWLRSLRLRTQLLLAVNLVVGGTTLGMLYLDYRASMDAALRSKTESLTDEANAIAEAVNALGHHGSDAIQSYLDSVCTAMNSGTSPGHTVEAWQVTGLYFASHTHMVDGESTSRIRGESGSDPTLVRVSELAAPVVESARTTALRRAAVLLGAAAVAAGVVNTLLIRLMTTPIENLARLVRTFGQTRSDVPLPQASSAEIATLTGELGIMMSDLARREADRTAQLARARRLQSHLISAPAGDQRLAVEYHPADEVAGDFVDILTLPSGDRIVCLGDVVGHGVPAAMGAAVLKALVISLQGQDLTPAELLDAVNRGVLRASLPEDFVSMIAVRLPNGDGPVCYASAGHETCFAVHANGLVTELSSTGGLLGIDPKAEFVDTNLDLDEGDVLVLISDGISEAMDERGRLLGRSRISDSLRSTPCVSAKSTAASVLDTARRHLDGRPASDDMTVIALEVSTTTRAQEVNG